MIFQKSTPKQVENQEFEEYDNHAELNDDVDTVVGPSVHVEGDFASEGNIVVKGIVSGSVYTSKHLTVESGAKILANVKAGSATVSGEVKGNMKVKDSLELKSTSKVLGDIDVKNLKVELGAILYGKVTMPGVDPSEKPSKKISMKKSDEMTVGETA